MKLTGMKGTLVLTTVLLLLSLEAGRTQPSIVQEPTDQIRAPGSVAVFSVRADGTAPLQYQWQFNGADIPGARGAVLRLISTPTRAGLYRAVVRDGSGAERATSPAILEVKPRPRVVAQPRSTLVPEFGTAVFSTTLNDSGPYGTIVWHNTNPLEGPHIIPDGLGFDVRQPTLSIPNCLNTDSYNGFYWISVTNEVGGTVSRKARLIVVPKPEVLLHPQDKVVRRGGTVVISFVLARDAAPSKTYQWYHNGEPMEGRTSRLLRVTRVDEEDVGFYDCVVTSMGGSTRTGGAYVGLLQ